MSTEQGSDNESGQGAGNANTTTDQVESSKDPKLNVSLQHITAGDKSRKTKETDGRPK